MFILWVLFYARYVCKYSCVCICMYINKYIYTEEMFAPFSEVKVGAYGYVWLNYLKSASNVDVFFSIIYLYIIEIVSLSLSLAKYTIINIQTQTNIHTKTWLQTTVIHVNCTNKLSRQSRNNCINLASTKVFYS